MGFRVYFPIVIIISFIVGTVDAEGNITTSSGDLYLIPAGGNVFINGSIKSPTGSRMGIGTTSPNFDLEVQGTAALGLFKRYDSQALNAPGFLCTKSRGSLASPSSIQSGDVLGKMQFRGYVGSDKNYGFFGFIASDTNQNGYFTFRPSDLSTNLFTINTNGQVSAAGTSKAGADTFSVGGSSYSSGGWHTSNADYAEWFEKESESHVGDVIGINPTSGKARRFIMGDYYIGIHSSDPSIVGNRLLETNNEMEDTHVLVGLLGQLNVDKSQIVIENRIVRTLDGQRIGILLNNGKVLIGR